MIVELREDTRKITLEFIAFIRLDKKMKPVLIGLLIA